MPRESTKPRSFTPAGVVSTEREALLELAIRRTEDSLESFMLAYPPSPNYLWGVHTRVLIQELSRATVRLENGLSTYLLVCMPPRHGKSDVVSRRWPAWHLIRNPHHELILASYNFELASSMSYDVRDLLREIGALYGLFLEKDRSALTSWKLSGSRGAVHSVGIGGTITGRGAHVLAVDDYFKNREEAESEVTRQKRWESFQSDLLTRLAPSHIVAIVANRWHEDDIVGRILRKNDPSSTEYDVSFPVFRYITFPAFREPASQDSPNGGSGSPPEDGSPDPYVAPAGMNLSPSGVSVEDDPYVAPEWSGWLFPERFSAEWYESQRAFMGAYAWQAQGMQDPTPRSGNLLRADLVRFVDTNHEPFPKHLRFTRGWDLARTEKERTKDDPDFTCGTLAAFDRKTDTVYVKDVVHARWSPLIRDARIQDTCIRDGRHVPVHVEAGPDSKDAFFYLRRLLGGRTVVRAVTPHKDKVIRATRLEAIFEGSRVIAAKAPWNEFWQKECLVFPGGRHDDIVDSLVVSLEYELGRRSTMGVGSLI